MLSRRQTPCENHHGGKIKILSQNSSVELIKYHQDPKYMKLRERRIMIVLYSQHLVMRLDDDQEIIPEHQML